MCRSRRELSNEQIANSNEYLFAKFGFDTAENEPCKVCPLSAYKPPRSWWRGGDAPPTPEDEAKIYLEDASRRALRVMDAFEKVMHLYSSLTHVQEDEDAALQCASEILSTVQDSVYSNSNLERIFSNF